TGIQEEVLSSLNFVLTLEIEIEKRRTRIRSENWYECIAFSLKDGNNALFISFFNDTNTCTYLKWGQQATCGIRAIFSCVFSSNIAIINGVKIYE
ncbi:hypothetical protein ACJX0J_031288, partial [Zea mays]